MKFNLSELKQCLTTKWKQRGSTLPKSEPTSNNDYQVTRIYITLNKILTTKDENIKRCAKNVIWKTKLAP